MAEIDDAEDLNSYTQIQNKYTFWYRGGTASAGKAATTNYNDSIKRIASFHTAEHFWRIYDHLKRPSSFSVTTEYHLFKEGITPTWEDPQNKLGGKWMIRLKKGVASRYWEDIVLAIIGEQFDVGPEICGAVISVRHGEDIISVWNKTADNQEAVTKIRDQIRRILKLPSIIQIEYKKHQDSLVDKSSYRNPNVVWKAPVGSTPVHQNKDFSKPGYVQGQQSHDGRPDHRQQQIGGGWSSSSGAGRGGNRATPSDHHHRDGADQHQQHRDAATRDHGDGQNRSSGRGWGAFGSGGSGGARPATTDHHRERSGSGHDEGAAQHHSSSRTAATRGPSGGAAATATGVPAAAASSGGWVRGVGVAAGAPSVSKTSADGKESTGASSDAPAAAAMVSPSPAPQGYKRVPFPGIGASSSLAATTGGTRNTADSSATPSAR